MIRHQMDFFNVAALEQKNGIPGYILQRFPRVVRHGLGRDAIEIGRFRAQVSTGCEIRFVTDSPAVRLMLHALECDGDVSIWFGDYFHSMHRLKAGVTKPLLVEVPERFRKLRDDMAQDSRFDPAVWRVVIGRGYSAMAIFSVSVVDVDTFGHALRAPEEGEVPEVRWLAYGSSITHGSGATVNHHSYIQQAARRLGVDVLNKGIGGSCFCEPEMAGFLASEKWDIITLEIGVNMREHFSPQDFEMRARFMVESLQEACPGKPIVLVTMFPNDGDAEAMEDTAEGLRNVAFRNVLRQIFREYNHKDVYLIEGEDILTDTSALTHDLLHPSDYGHMLMGERMALRLGSILRERKILL